MTMTTGTTTKDLLRKDLKATFSTLNNTHKYQFTDLYDVDNEKINYQEYRAVSGFGEIPEKVEGKSIDYEEAVSGYSKKIPNISYGLGFKVTREMREFNQYKMISKWMKALMESKDQTMNVLAAKIFNDAFDSTEYSLNSTSICSTTHALAKGGTASNRPASAGSLSPTTLKQDLINIETTMAKDENGKTIVLQGEKLLVPPALRFTAAEILKSTLLADTAENNMNSLNGQLDLKVMNFLTDSAAHFITTNHADKPVWQTPVAPEFGQDNDFSSDDMLMKLFFITGFGVYNWRAFYGNPSS